MKHTIKLKVEGGTVLANPNPLSGVHPGDTVTFQVGGESAGRGFEVEFHEVRRPCAPTGPFVGALEGPGPLVSTVAPGQQDRFIYNVFEVRSAPGNPGLTKRVRLTWAVGLESGGNFGGIDVGSPPPDQG